MAKGSDDDHDTLVRRAHLALRHWDTDAALPGLHTHRENAVFRVEMGGQFAALRLHRPGYHDKESLVSELSWMEHLRASGLRVPSPLKTGDGRLLVTLPADGEFPAQHSDLLTWVRGQPLGKSGEPMGRPAHSLPNLFRAIGATVARLHNLSDPWSLPGDFRRPNLGADGILGERPFWGRFWESPHLSEDQSRRLLLIRTELLEHLSRAAPTDFGLIHADLVRENILLDGAEIAFIDFDDCAFGWRLYDLAVILANHRNEEHYDLIETGLLEGYRGVRPLSSSDAALLPVFILMRNLSYVGWISDRPELPGAGRRLDRYLTASFNCAHMLGIG